MITHELKDGDLISRDNPPSVAWIAKIEGDEVEFFRVDLTSGVRGSSSGDTYDMSTHDFKTTVIVFNDTAPLSVWELVYKDEPFTILEALERGAVGMLAELVDG